MVVTSFDESIVIETCAMFHLLGLNNANKSIEPTRPTLAVLFEPQCRAAHANRWSRRFAPAPSALRITTHLMAVAARRPSSG